MGGKGWEGRGGREGVGGGGVVFSVIKARADQTNFANNLVDCETRTRREIRQMGLKIS